MMIKQLNRDLHGDYTKDSYVYARCRQEGAERVWRVEKRLSRYGGVKVSAEDIRSPDVFVDANLEPVLVGDTIARLNTSPHTFWLETRKVISVTPDAIMLAPLPGHGTRITSTSKNTNVIIVRRGNEDLLLKYMMHVGGQAGRYFLGNSLINNPNFSDDERQTLRNLINTQR